MNINDAVLQRGEKTVFALRELYYSRGYRPYRMSKFEEYDLYADNKDFLVSDHVITFTDPGGKLMALKPDVTLSIIKNSTDAPGETRKVFYSENVYRVSRSTGSFGEIMQTGVECFGRIGTQEVCEVLTLALESLRTVAQGPVLALSDLEVLASLTGKLGLAAEENRALYRAIGEKNRGAITALCAPCADTDAVKRLMELLALHGTLAQTLPRLDALLGEEPAYAAFRAVASALTETPLAELVRIDFSLVDDPHYYNGIIFKGFVRDVPTAVLSGGQYDNLMRKLGRRSCAVGFAVYTDALDRLDPDGGETGRGADGFLNIALPKGRLGEKVYERFARAGYECPSLLEPNRKLVFENPEKGVRYFWVKPSDVPIYVERGAADLGVAGKDILLEEEPDIYELLDLGEGRCRMVVAAPRGFTDAPERTLHVATKFSRIAGEHYRAKGRDIDIIHLNGSIEIAPILGLSDVIVDIVETGTTLRENDLEVVETVCPITARLIANKASFKFKAGAIEALAAALSAETEEEA